MLLRRRLELIGELRVERAAHHRFVVCALRHHAAGVEHNSRSAAWMVENRWAMTNVVRSCCSLRKLDDPRLPTRRAQELTEQTNETYVYDLMQTIRKEIPSTDE